MLLPWPQRVALALYSLANTFHLLDNPVASWLFVRTYFLYKRFIEDPFAALLRANPNIIGEGHVFDIGANVGYTARLFARAVRPGYRVYAFEPERINFSRLCKVVAGDWRIVPVQMAVGSDAGEIELWTNSTHHGDHRIVTPRFAMRNPVSDSTTVVKMTSVDEFANAISARGRISFVKIDVQGYEISVLEGMERTLREDRFVVLAIEYSPSLLVEMGFEPARLIEILRDHGFVLHTVAGNGALSERSYDDVERSTQHYGYVDLICSRDSLAKT